MGKNLKRQNDVLFGTPSRQGGKQPISVAGKRHKQMTLVPFLRTPAHMEETPALQPKLPKGDISSTGLQKLGQLNLRTQQKQQQQNAPSVVAPTQERPAVEEVDWREASPEGDDDFIISMSQTYERTQPEPCSDYGRPANCDDVELSLRRSQHYLASGPTQHYHGQHHHDQHHYHRQHHHDLLLVTAAAAALDTTTTAAAHATSTAADAWEASVAEASALDGGVSAAATLLPPPPQQQHALEGQGSNQLVQLAQPCAEPAHGAEDAQDTDPVRDAFAFGHRRLLGPRPPPAAASGPDRTPELQGPGASCVTAGSGSACTAATEDVADDGTTPPLQVGVPLFPIFTQGRRKRKQPIYLIRHGESEYNLACKHRGGFHDPHDIFDARLTPNGVKQARDLRPQLFDLMQKHGDPLFIVSPLSRAIETFLNMLPDPGRLRVCPSTPPAQAAGGAGAAGSVRSARSGLHGKEGKEQCPPGGEADTSGAICLANKPINMMICPVLSEFLQTTGDVGRTRSELIKDYPQIAEQLRKGLDRERWWYENTSRGPNCSTARTLTSMEPDKAAKARVDRFRSFVFSQPYRPIVVVGHANFFRTLMNDSHYMANCQMTAWVPP